MSDRPPRGGGFSVPTTLTAFTLCTVNSERHGTYGEADTILVLKLAFAISGLPGMCSVHANSARDALSKLCTLPLLAGRNIDASFVVPTVAQVIDVVVHLELERSGHRRIIEIVAPSGVVTGSVIEASTIFRLDHGVLEATGAYPAKTTGFAAAGYDLAAVLARGGS